MTAFAKIVTNLKQLQNNLDAEIVNILKNGHPGLIEDLNREMLLDGRNNEGQLIRPKYRNSKYARRKQALNSKPPLGTPDIKLTGKYHKSLKAKFQGNDILIDSSDSKDADLSAKYEGIKGLGPPEEFQLREAVTPDLRTLFLTKMLSR